MSVELKKYHWQFFRYYLLGYAIGMAALFSVAYFFNVRMPDLILIVILCMIVPQTLSDDFIKNEKRFFTDDELSIMIKRSSLTSFMINFIPSFMFLGYCIVLKSTHMTSPFPNPLLTEFLQFSLTYLLLILVGSGALYYLISRLLIGLSYKRKKSYLNPK